MMRRYIDLAWILSAAIVLALLPPGAVRAAPPVAEPFRAYYDGHQGIRVLGYPVTALVEAEGYPAQYFEKGRIEDHARDVVIVS